MPFQIEILITLIFGVIFYIEVGVIKDKDKAKVEK